MARRAASLLPFIAMAAACSGAEPGSSVVRPGVGPAFASQGGGLAHVDVRKVDGKPRLAILERAGDPVPAIVASVATDTPPAITTALAAVVEARLKAAGLAFDVRVDRASFRVRFAVGDASKVASIFAALAGAFARPIAPGSPEIALAAKRLDSLKRNALDGPEMEAVAACRGALGAGPHDAIPDATGPTFARDLDTYRGVALVAQRTAIAAVGPAASCEAAARAFDATAGWPIGTPAADAWPAADVVGAYPLVSSERAEPRPARLSIAVRVGDPELAASAAERLGAADSPLVARLAALADPWRVIDVAGVARPRGGCVAVTLQPASQEGASRAEGALADRSALAAGISRAQILFELAAGRSADVASKQVLAAGDAIDAASRASWWALAGSAEKDARPAWAVALGAPRTTNGADPADAFRAAFGKIVAASDRPVLERRVAVERGQGEVWVVVASPCGAAEEGVNDTGFTAIAASSAIDPRRRFDDVAVEPWITADGIGVVAHAALRDGEAPNDLAKRAGSSAARAIAGAWFGVDAVATARTATLELLERTEGRQGSAFAAFAAAAAPGHPSWLEPRGTWDRVAAAGVLGAREAWQALAAGPLRVAVIANADAAQAAEAAAAADRWFMPHANEHACRASAAEAPHAGHFDARLPSGTTLAQTLAGAPLAPSTPREVAELAVLALNGDSGILGRALSQASAASARLVGGGRASAIVIDVRAPADALSGASTELRALLPKLAERLTDADFSRARAAYDERARILRADPRRRAIDLWLGRTATAPPAAPALRDFFSATFREAALVVVDARPE